MESTRRQGITRSVAAVAAAAVMGIGAMAVPALANHGTPTQIRSESEHGIAATASISPSFQNIPNGTAYWTATYAGNGPSGSVEFYYGDGTYRTWPYPTGTALRSAPTSRAFHPCSGTTYNQLLRVLQLGTTPIASATASTYVRGSGAC